MIIFEGQITGECLKEYKKMHKIEVFIALISLFLSWIIVNALVTYISNIDWFAMLVISICYLCASLFLAVMLYVRSKPWNKICIDSTNNTISFSRSKKAICIKLDIISTVEDRGEFYSIPEIDTAVLCQKSLLVEGTIEEFENLFEGKIIRKY